MDLITEQPIWYTILCLALGAGYSFFLYRKDKLLQDVSLWLRWLLAFFRFAVTSLLAFFLLSPLLKTIFREVEKPIIVIAQDNSESLLINNDSVYYEKEYQNQFNELSKELSKKYDVKTYSFGSGISEDVNFDFSEKQTDLSAVFDEIYNRYSNRNVGAIILATDGIYNKGANPLYSSKLKMPVYAIALGDTSVKKDLILKKVAHNRLAYLGNFFPFEAIVEAKRLKGNRANLKVTRGSQTIFTQIIEIDRELFSIKIPIQIEAKQTGIQRYTVRLSELEGEISHANNTQHIFIDVLDARQKILLLATVPHPDVAAIRQSIESNENYEVEVHLAADFTKSFKDYSMVILHQMPASGLTRNKIINAVKAELLPVLVILGGSVSVNRLEGLQTGLQITANRGKTSDSQGIVDKNFNLFTISAAARNYINQFPPLQTPFGNYKTSNSANIFLRQKIGLVETDYPLMLFNSVNGQKTGIIVGDGIWRWRLSDFAQHGNHEIFNEIISKTVQYLAAKEDKSHFRVSSKDNFLENESVIFDAEVYNESYELVNDVEVNIEIINEEEKKFPYAFSKTSKAYRLNAGNFPVGEYQYEAKIRLGEKVLIEKGEFTVSAIQVESVNTVADHQLLYNLAKKHGGEMLLPHEMNKLPQLLEQRGDIKPVIYTQKKLRDLINLKWVFFLLLGLLSLEWFVRKRSGAY